MVILAFIFGVVITFFALGLVVHCKDNDPKNKVRFFVRKSEQDVTLYLYNDKTSTFYKITCGEFLKEFGLNLNDFENMGEGDLKQVFLNLED